MPSEHDMTETDSLIEYPCEFPIKIMGRSDVLADQISLSNQNDPVQQSLSQSVLVIVKRHAPDFDDAGMTIRVSGGGKYLSLTCTINAVSRTQLDALYRELCAHPSVVMVL
jgi:putative lipoic acid-binding regulatory protein